ncbi:MAG TPA: thiopeptide-type bacteriocin biosynthesis protein, partial [Acidimicrobiales bacterium]
MLMPANWRQYNIEFPDPRTADVAAAQHLRPALVAAQNDGTLRGWWFVRKQPWKLRYQADPHTDTPLDELLDALTGDYVTSWTMGVYEPETLAFGGEDGMHVAHELFHADSYHLLIRAPGRDTPTALGSRETAVVLCGAMLRAAGLDWFEQGDVWAKVAALRPTQQPPPGKITLVAKMQRLMTTDTRTLCDPRRGGPLVGLDIWVAAFEQAGQELFHLARHGRLQRGLRAVLAHHVIFHANRAGLSVPDLSTLAALALNTVFAPPDTP